MSWLALLAILLVMTGIPAVILSPKHHRWRWGVGVIVALLIAIVCAAFDIPARKTLQALLMPSGFAWMLIGGLATGCFMLHFHRIGTVLTVTFVLMGLGGNYWCGAMLMANLERRVDVQASASDEQYDVVCVLGGGASRRYDGQPQFGANGDRLRLGVLLHRQQRTPLLLTTGFFAPDSRHLWVQLGVPADHVLMDREPDNTNEELALIKRLAGERGWKRIGVVSSAWHLPRVTLLAARQGLSILPLPCDWLGAVPPWTAEMLVPKGDGARLIELALKEHLGLMLGR